MVSIDLRDKDTVAQEMMGEKAYAKNEKSHHHHRHHLCTFNDDVRWVIHKLNLENATRG